MVEALKVLSTINNPWGRRPQNHSGTGRDPITNWETGNESFWGYKDKVK